jgi:V8-like Glu-specific endopeptidase
VSGSPVTLTVNQAYYSAVVAIWVGFENDPVGTIRAGTGVLIGRNEILTAAHIFEAPGAGQVTTIMVLTGPEATLNNTIPMQVQDLCQLSSEFCSHNISMSLGNNDSPNRGPGPLALVNGFDTYAGSSQADPSHDLAVLGVSKNIGDSLGVLPIQQNAQAGTYTLVGFPGYNSTLGYNGGNLVVNKGLATISTVIERAHGRDLTPRFRKE